MKSHFGIITSKSIKSSQLGVRMKRILIIADGILAKHFLERVMISDTSDNLYDVVYYRDKTLPEKKAEDFTFLKFDPTSFEKLHPLLNRDYYQVMIIVSKKIDATATYQNIRTLDKEIQIVFMDRWETKYDDHRLVILDSKNVLSSRFVDYLPDVPVVAQNVGLGSGEIMEIRVPIGSSYVYRHLASIHQKKWRISAIYRANSIILPRPTLMIQPNDVLLVIGDPNVLQSVYKSIKKELGQFPAPFGNSLYCIIDMLNMPQGEIERMVNDALLLHAKINSMKLYIKIVNPTYSKLFEKIKDYDSKYIRVNIDYYNTKAAKVMKEDLKDSDVGLLIVTKEFFKQYTRTLYNTRIPVFKVGIWGFSNMKESVVLTSCKEDIEKESSVIFDLSNQLELDIKLYNFNPDGLKERNELVEHFENLSKLFAKEVEIISENKNPLLKLSYRQDVLQFIPFHAKILDSTPLAIFSTDMEKLHFKLANSYQLFIPIPD
jgi:uncharacterized protein